VSDLEEIVAIVAGYAFALAGGYLYLARIVELLWSLDEDRAPGSFPRVPGLVGLVERALYVTALLLGMPAFVLVWLALKLVADWRIERHWGESPQLVHGVFFVGSGLSLLYAAAGWLIVRFGAESAWLEATLVAVGLLAGCRALEQLLLHEGKRLAGETGERAAERSSVSTESLVTAVSERSPVAADVVDGDGAVAPEPTSTEAETTASAPPPELPSEVATEEPEDPPLPEVTIPTPPRTRRSPEEIVERAEEVRALVRESPGQGVAELAEVLGTTTPELRRPIELLVEGKMLRRTGTGRQTQYFPGPSRRKSVARAATGSRGGKASRRKKRR